MLKTKHEIDVIVTVVNQKSIIKILDKQIEAIDEHQFFK